MLLERRGTCQAMSLIPDDAALSINESSHALAPGLAASKNVPRARRTSMCEMRVEIAFAITASGSYTG